MTEREKPQTLDPIPEQYAKGDWAPVSYTTEEGGEWIKAGVEPPLNYSALQYANGWIYDNVLRQMNVNPWRHVEDEETTIAEVDHRP